MVMFSKQDWCLKIASGARQLGLLWGLSGCTPSAVVATLLPDHEIIVDAASEIVARGATELAVGTKQRAGVVVLPPAGQFNGPQPLVVLLHGYGVPVSYLDAYLDLRKLTRARGMYLLLLDSSNDSAGLQYWNATDACCNFDHTDVDDVEEVNAAIDQVLAALPVDETRIYLVGHSNGGFMAYRLACERSERYAGIAVLAGADYLEPNFCVSSMPVSVLHLHGDADGIVNYSGGTVPSVLGKLAAFPSAQSSVERWAARAGCDSKPVLGERLDLTTDETDGTATETEVANFVGCKSGIDVALWTLRGAGHEPAFHDRAFDSALAWLAQHRR